uniref:hypothetical protein n=1 Tax=Candidatus Electrothrix sp. TaxID=2170559 RepID=UPI004056D229
MANHNETSSFSLTLFNIYRRDPEVTVPDSPPSFAYTQKDGETHRIPFLQPDQEARKEVKSALRRFQPLAEKVFQDGNVLMTVQNDELLKELNQVWRVGKSRLPIRFTRIGGFLLEQDYLCLYIEVRPDRVETAEDELAAAAVRITNKLSYKGHSCKKTEDDSGLNSSQLIREFKNEEHRKSAKNRFQGNDDLPLIQSVLGEALTLEDIFDTLAGPGWDSMLRDRFLLNSLLITPTGDPAPTYSEADKADLVRRARGMNSAYLPPPLENLTGHVIPVQTFANVLFTAANEGIAGHVKPAPPRPRFLRDQFPSRYRSEYTLLFVLAVYQHYRLIDLIRELADHTAHLHETRQFPDSARIEELRQLRQKLAVHEVKYINTQPAFLTNYQQYYTGLRQGLNTGALVEKLRRSTIELDTLLADADQREKKKRKEQQEKGKRVLAYTAECVAFPYYLYNLLEHALHQFHVPVCWAWVVTIPATGALIFYTRHIMRRRE